MTQVIYTYPDFPDDGNTVASGQQVTQNFNDVKTVVNGQLEDTNILNDGITANTKIKDGTIDSNCMGNASIRDAHLTYPSASAGVKVWRMGPNYPGANGGTVIRVEKSITIAAVTTDQAFAVSWATTDGVDGALTFSAPPTLSGVSFLDTVGAIDNTMQYCKFTARTASGCTLRVKFSTAPTGGAVTAMFFAAGGL